MAVCRCANNRSYINGCSIINSQPQTMALDCLSQQKQFLIESKSDNDEQEAKKTESKKKKPYLRESNSDDEEINNKGPSNKGTNNNTETVNEDD